MKKHEWNLLIDAAMFLVMGLISGLGLLMHYVLIPGYEQWQKYGVNADLTWGGLNRHQWGYIHLFLGLLLLCLLVLHIILHWKIIVCLLQRIISNSKTRTVITFLFLLLFVVFFLFPFIINVKVGDRAGSRQGSANLYSNDFQDKKTFSHDSVSQNEPNHGEHLYGIDIKGYMTIEEVAAKYGIPINSIKNGLGLSSSVKESEKLGVLRKTYGFTMSEVEKVVYEKLTSQKQE